MAPGLILALLVLNAVVLAMLRKRPHPNHEFMLDLYGRMLGEEPEPRDAASTARSASPDQLRRAS
jgi:hypothetical protein